MLGAKTSHKNVIETVMVYPDLVSVSRPIFASLGLGLEGFRSRDFECCKEMVHLNLYSSMIFCLLCLQVRNNQNTSEKCQKFEKNEVRSDDDIFS